MLHSNGEHLLPQYATADRFAICWIGANYNNRYITKGNVTTRGDKPVLISITNKYNKMKIIHCWSAPRSRSTALLYSFEARGSSTIALDEPLYRRWLEEKINHGESSIGISRP